MNLSHPTIAMVKLVIKLVIKYDMASWGNAFDVEYDDNVSISTLKDKVKEMMKPDLDNFAANSFSVWQCKDSGMTKWSKWPMKLRMSYKGTLTSYNPKSGFFLAVIGV